MPHSKLGSIWFFAALLASTAPLAAEAARPPACHGGAIDIGGRTLWAELAGAGEVTVVFETGNGADSTVWTEIAAMVLVDANIPDFFTAAEVDAILARYRPQYDALRKQAPELAATILPLLEAYPETAAKMRRVRLPARLPVIDIYAEHSWAETAESAAAMRRAHIAFAAAGRRRESVYAAGSSHHVMHDRPDLVLAAIAKAMARAGN